MIKHRKVNRTFIDWMRYLQNPKLLLKAYAFKASQKMYNNIYGIF